MKSFLQPNEERALHTRDGIYHQKVSVYSRRGVHGAAVGWGQGKFTSFPTKKEAIKFAKDMAKESRPGFIVTVDGCGKKDGAWMLQRNGRLVELKHLKV